MRAGGSGTGGPVVDSTVSVERVSELAKKVAWADVVKGTSGQQRLKSNESVSRDNSLETIQSVK